MDLLKTMSYRQWNEHTDLFYAYLSLTFDLKVVLKIQNICVIYTIGKHCVKYEPTTTEIKSSLDYKPHSITKLNIFGYGLYIQGHKWNSKPLLSSKLQR